MTGQKDLFRDEPMIAPRELHRRDDPSTSQEAAEHMVHTGKLGKMMKEALRLLRLYPGRTAAEIEFSDGVSDGRVRKRLNDLRKRGLARAGEKKKCSVTNRNAHRWWPTGGSDD